MTFRTVPGGRIVLDSGTRLRATFKSSDFNARSGEDTGGPARVFHKNGAIFVDQRVPRSIKRITVRSGASPGTLKLHRLDADKVAKESTVEIDPGDVLPDSIDEEFRDARFAIKANSLADSDIDDIVIRSYPTTPRVGLAPANGGSVETAIFATEAGEFRTDKTLDIRDVYRAALQRSLDEQASTGDHTIGVDLVLESDTPCSRSAPVNITPYVIQTNSFALPPTVDARTKMVLKFSENYLQTQRVDFDVPANSHVSSASVAVQIGAGGGIAVADPADMTVPVTPHGAEIGADYWLAIPLPIAVATLARSLAVGVMPTVADTVIDAEIRSDWQATPGGQALAKTQFELDGAQRRNWYREYFAEPVLLSGAGAWLLLRAAQGHAILLCNTAPDVTRDGTVADTRIVTGGEPLARLLMQAPPSAAAESGPITLRIGGTVITPVREAERLVFDIAGAINSELAAIPSSPSIHSIALEFLSSQPLLATVYAPELTFELESAG